MTARIETAIPFFGEAPAAIREPSLRLTVAAGFAVIAMFFGAFAGWSMFADLDSAVVANGTIVVDSHRKTLQHLEGGILRKLYVREGDVVKAGQLLAELDGTQAEATLGQATSQHFAVKARIARLRAERKGVRSISFSKDMTDHARDKVVADAMAAQQELFAARWRAHDSAIAILEKRIAQLNSQITAENALLESATAQAKFTGTELKNVRRLYKKGYERLPRLLELQRAKADLQGRANNARSNVARLDQTIASTRLQIAATRDARQAEIARDLQEALTLEASLSDRARAAQDVKDRNVIVAPLDGTVVGLKVFTIGGVVGPGQPLMDIVPSNDSLVVEAKVKPADIESVRKGLPARVRLTAYKRSTMKSIAGKVINVSADRLVDPRTGEPYFASRIKVDAKALAALKDVKLQPGMPAEVMIVTGERRAIDYFIGPLTERMRRAFHEQ